MKNLIKEWNEITLIKIFEQEVRNISTGEIDYIIFDLILDQKNKRFKAEHVALSKEQDENKYVSFVSVDIDTDFSIDHHLQELYDKCVNAIGEGGYYEVV